LSWPRGFLRLTVGAVAASSVVLSSVPRIWLAEGGLPNVFRPFVWSDLYLSYEQLLGPGRIPYWDTVFYYPPMVGYVAGLFSFVAPNAMTYLALWTLLLAAAAGLGGWLLAGITNARTALVYWSLSPQLLLYGGANFDVLPTLVVVSAILLARRGRQLAALGLLAVGTLLKAFPAAIAPLELDRMRRDKMRLAIGAAWFGGVGLLLALPSLLAEHPSTISVPQYAQRSNFESVWGLAAEVAAATGGQPAVLAVGAMSVIGLFATYLFGVLPQGRRVRDPAVGAGLAVVAVLLWSRLFSPQYTLWMLPFFVLLGLPRRLFVALSLVDVLVFLTIYPLTLIRWAPEDPGAVVLLGVLGGAVALRHLVLIAVWLRISRAASAAREEATA